MKENLELSEKISEVIQNLKPKPSQISFAVINLKQPNPEIAGYNMDEFIYPASIYKVFVGAEILRKVYESEINLSDNIEIKSYNEVSNKIRLFPTSTKSDPHPLLKIGDKVTVDYLLNLMFSRSDNTASNTLVSICNLKDINNNIILQNGWIGSEIDEKLVSKLKKGKEYRVSDITVSNARHLAEFFYKVEQGKMVNEWVSDKLRSYMKNWNRGGREGLYISGFTDYYRKGGWLEINIYKYNFLSAIINILRKGCAVSIWNNDAGVVRGENSHYAIALLSLNKSLFPWKNFPLKPFSKKIHTLMENV